MEEWEGKLPPSLLEKLVLGVVRKRDPRVLVGPSVGEDAAVIDFGDKVLVVHSDPITGAVRNIGWYAVHIACNDVATRGAKPRWLLPVLLVPRGRIELVERIAADVRRAADEIDATVIGGHTELTPGLNRPIVSMTAIGEAGRESYVTTSMCKPGDSIILTKGAAIEGTAIIASELEEMLRDRISRSVLERAKGFIERISIVRDAMTAISVGGVHAMHDPTEGGVAGGLQELAMASGLGVVAWEEEMIVAEETRAVLSAVGADPLRTISSGSLLIAVDPARAPAVLAGLKQRGIPASIIGRMLPDPEERYIVRSDGTRMDLSVHVEDDLWRVLREVLE